MTALVEPDVRPAPSVGAPAAAASAPAVEHWLARSSRRVLRGRPEDPPWARPALLALLGATAVLYLWGLGASGWANSYYSAAAQAGATSWKAWFFGSIDAGNAITVDKSPGALWAMGLSARLFGVSSWSVLVPQALMGVASVGVLHATVKRWWGSGAGLLAGLVLALTPVATLMFRFNNPDAMLVLLLAGSLYAVVRALESASTRWIALAGALVGFAFLAKMLQAFVILPVLALVYLLAAPTAFVRRVGQTVVLGVATLVSAGWWVAIVSLWPKSSRPYIGGSQDDSVWNLLIGYNGLGRLSGDEPGSVGGGGNGTARWGATGWNRLFGADMGGQISWLIPAALVFLVAGLLWRGRRPRTDRLRAALLLWGGWLLLTGAVISFGQGIIHAYYTVALAPAIGALVGMGAVTAWRHRDDPLARAALAAALAATAAWGAVLLDRTPDWMPGLRPLVLVGGLAAAAAVMALPWLSRRLAVGVGVGALVVGLAAPAAYSLSTARTPHSGALPTAGPAAAGGFGGPGPGGGGPGGGGAPPVNRLGPGTGTGNGTFGGPAAGGFGGNGGGIGGGGTGGLLSASSPSTKLVEALQADADGYTWVAATTGANRAAGYQLSSGEAVLAIGGFNGSDPSPTLDEFVAYVEAGRIHYYIDGGQMGGGPGAGGEDGGTAAAIGEWVTDHADATTIGGTTVYDLSSLAS